jgi:hypothetical protein
VLKQDSEETAKAENPENALEEAWACLKKPESPEVSALGLLIQALQAYAEATDQYIQHFQLSVTFANLDSAKRNEIIDSESSNLSGIGPVLLAKINQKFQELFDEAEKTRRSKAPESHQELPKDSKSQR